MLAEWRIHCFCHMDGSESKGNNLPSGTIRIPHVVEESCEQRILSTPKRCVIGNRMQGTQSLCVVCYLLIHCARLRMNLSYEKSRLREH